MIIAVVVALAVGVLIPRLGGATPYTILTSSMRPDLPPGTLVVVKPVDPTTVAVGSVITYQRESGRSEVVTHRVVQVASDALGQPQWRTQGDANPVRDGDWIRPVQLKGELWYAVPHLGRVSRWLSSEQRQAAVVILALALFGYAARMWFGALGDRVRSPAHRAVTR